MINELIFPNVEQVYTFFVAMPVTYIIIRRKCCPEESNYGTSNAVSVYVASYVLNNEPDVERQTRSNMDKQ